MKSTNSIHVLYEDNEKILPFKAIMMFWADNGVWKMSKLLLEWYVILIRLKQPQVLLNIWKFYYSFHIGKFCTENSHCDEGQVCISYQGENVATVGKCLKGMDKTGIPNNRWICCWDNIIYC